MIPRAFRDLERDVSRMLFRPEQQQITAFNPRSMYDMMDLNFGSAAAVPALNVTEAENKYVVEAELPGVKKHDLDVKIVNGNTLVMSGHFASEHKQESDAKNNQRVWAMERTTGAFHREFVFPNEVETDNVQTEYRDGLLRMVVPKAQSQQNVKVIDIS